MNEMTAPEQAISGEETPSRDLVEDQIRRLASSRALAASESVRKLFLYLVKTTLASPATAPKELDIAIDVLGRPPDFDPRVDASVRVLAVRLRSKLAEYYMAEGGGDPVTIELPRGDYRLRFHAAAPAASPALLAPAGLEPEVEEFWRPFLRSQKRTALVLGTPMMFRFRDFFFRDSTVNAPDAASRSPAILAVERALGASGTPAYHYTGVGEAVAAVLVTQIIGSRLTESAVRRSFALGWDELRADNVVIFGATRLNPQVKNLPFACDFVSEGGCEGAIRNLRPQPGEAAEYGSVQMPGTAGLSGYMAEGHSLITRASGVPGYGEILVLSGYTTEGTWAAAEYLIEGHHLRELFRKIRRPDGRLPGAYQVVIKARFESQVPVSISYVTHHELDLAAAGPAR